MPGQPRPPLSLIANYTLSKAQTWGCVLGELFDYVNGVCDPLNPFAPGDYGPSGEDVRHRAVLAATWHAPRKIELSTVAQAESARPFTITTADNAGRIAINGVPTSSTNSAALPTSKPICASAGRSRWETMDATPFVEFFNLFNRNNPGANYVTNIASLPVPAGEAQAGNVTDICSNADCSATRRSAAQTSCAMRGAHSETSLAPAPPSAFRSPRRWACA